MEDTIKIPTGIEGFDRDTGGLAEGKTYVLSGGAHTAKTVFAAQYLKQGIDREENALLLTDGEPENFLKLDSDLELGLERFLKTGQFVLLRYLFQAEDIIRGEKDLSIMLGELENFLLANRIHRMAVDSAVPLFQLIHREWFEKGIKILTGEIGKLGVTSLFTSRMPATQKALEIKNHAERNSSGSIHLDELTRDTGKTVRRMTIRSLSHIEQPYPVYEFEIKKGEGITITSRSSTGLESPREKIFPKSKERGVSFSKEYSSDSASEKRAPSADWPGPKQPEGKKGFSFSDKYEINND